MYASEGGGHEKVYTIRQVGFYSKNKQPIRTTGEGVKRSQNVAYVLYRRSITAVGTAVVRSPVAFFSPFDFDTMIMGTEGLAAAATAAAKHRTPFLSIACCRRHPEWLSIAVGIST